MAKAPNTSTPSAAPVFVIETGVALPAIERKIGAPASPYAEYMRKLGLGKGPDKLQSFFVPAADAPDTITDPAEKAKALKDNARKLSNQLSGITRRITKNGESDASGKYAFALRTMAVKVNGTDKLGVRVFRVSAATSPVAA